MNNSVFDFLFADIGSTKTMVSAFTGISNNQPRFLKQGVSPTTINEGDVCIGLGRAISDLERKLGARRSKWRTLMATCSAAGGLRMAAHGLVKSMTSKAARETALGAGAVVVSDTYGILSEDQVKTIMKSSPKIILLAGGVDGGEAKKVLKNARILASTNSAFSLVYAGNKSISSEIRNIFASSKVRLFVTENVYPTIDQLNVTPARNLIHQIFEDHLIESPGMGKVKEMVDGPVLPTPGAVMMASQILAQEIGDLITMDVGGATTDVHSVTNGSQEVKEIMVNLEPYAKRTVEGDLGVYVNAPQVFRLLVEKQTPSNSEERDLPQPLPLFPRTTREVAFLQDLTKVALSKALHRHVGKRKRVLTYKGEREVAEGKDLTAVRWVIGTGGVLTRLPGGHRILFETFNSRNSDVLLPQRKISILIDRHYIMAAAGLMGLKSPEMALEMMKASLVNPNTKIWGKK